MNSSVDSCMNAFVNTNIPMLQVFLMHAREGLEEKTQEVKAMNDRLVKYETELKRLITHLQSGRCGWM